MYVSLNCAEAEGHDRMVFPEGGNDLDATHEPSAPLCEFPSPFGL
jgi:hypothetical protein